MGNSIAHDQHDIIKVPLADSPIYRSVDNKFKGVVAGYEGSKTVCWFSRTFWRKRLSLVYRIREKK